MKSLDIDLLHSSVTRAHSSSSSSSVTERDESPRRHSLTALPSLTRTQSNPFIKRQSLNSHLSSYTRPAPDPRITLLPAHLPSKFFFLVFPFPFLFFPLDACQNPAKKNKSPNSHREDGFPAVPISNLLLLFYFTTNWNQIRRIWIVALFGSVVFRLFVGVVKFSARLADAPPGRLCSLEGVPASGARQVGHLGRAGPHEASLDGRFAGQPAFGLVYQG